MTEPKGLEASVYEKALWGLDVPPQYGHVNECSLLRVTSDCPHPCHRYRATLAARGGAPEKPSRAALMHLWRTVQGWMAGPSKFPYTGWPDVEGAIARCREEEGSTS
jgi:hypothetical protein